VDLLPQFIARSKRRFSHPLLVFEAIQNDMSQFFYQRKDDLGIGMATIANISKIFIRICFGKQIQLLDIIEDKLFLCKVSVRSTGGTTVNIAPDLARTLDQEQYAVLRDQRRQYMHYLLDKLKNGQEEPFDSQTYRNWVYSLLLPDLENFLNLPMMRDLFESREVLYACLTKIPSANKNG
jgi:hypothetical protein